MNTTEDRFEERLLFALRTVVDANPTPVHSLRPSPRSMRRPVLVGGAVAGAAVTASSLLIAGGSSAAYAVDAHSDGSVTVTIESFRDAAGLQSKLGAAGIKAVVDYLPAGKACKQPRYQPASAGAQQSSLKVDTVKGGGATFTIGNGQIPAGDTLVIETSGGQDYSSIGLGVATGAVAPCQAVDSPVPVPPTGGDSGPGLTTGSGPNQGTTT
ncbi:MAG: hypothetical protein QOJ11_2569 [Frankiales bacterium]|nr:hypothetical protein [Frankiales bacterium]